jgi:hypothetical protein
MKALNEARKYLASTATNLLRKKEKMNILNFYFDRLTLAPFEFLTKRPLSFQFLPEHHSMHQTALLLKWSGDLLFHNFKLCISIPKVISFLVISP